MSTRLLVNKVSTVQVSNSMVLAGQSFYLPVMLDACGGENAIGLSLGFDPAVLRFTEVRLAAAGAALQVNDSLSREGFVGIGLARSPGESFSVGRHTLAEIGFLVSSTEPPTTMEIALVNQPTSLEVVDVRANQVEAEFKGGTITVEAGRPQRDQVLDFNGDKKADLVFQNDEGFLATWFMNGSVLTEARLLTPNSVGDRAWRVTTSGDFDGDGQQDLVFQHRSGTLALWYMRETFLEAAEFFEPRTLNDSDWDVVGSGDFNQDGAPDLLFQHRKGALAAWLMAGTKLASADFLSPTHPGDQAWRVVAVAHLNGDEHIDLIFQHEDGTLAAWFMNGLRLQESSLLTPVRPSERAWRVVGAGDFNKDQKADLLFQHKEDGRLAFWYLDQAELIESRASEPLSPGGSWKVVAP